MTKANFRRTLVGAAVAAALGVVGPADAGPYRGTFDPIDFSGEYIIDVSPACLAQGNGWYANSGMCAATLTSAFADVASSSPGDPDYYGRLTFAPPEISSASQLFGLYVYGGKLDSFDTVLIHQTGESPSTPDDWWLQFVSGHCPVGQDCYGGFVPLLFDAAPASTLGNGVYLFVGSEPNANSPAASAEYLGPAVAIPEPGTLSLLLGALGGGWLARRRRKEKVPDTN
jgi:hypothetical protein